MGWVLASPVLAPYFYILPRYPTQGRECEIWKEKRKERTMISDCYTKDRDSDYVSEII